MDQVSPTGLRTFVKYVHMALRTQNVEPKWGQCLMYFAEEPITRCKAANENNMLKSRKAIVSNTTLDMQNMLKT